MRNVTRRELLQHGIPLNQPICFVTQEFRDSLPASVAEDDRPMTWDLWRQFLEEMEAAAEANEGATPGTWQERPLNPRQVAFAEALAGGAEPRAAYVTAGFAPHRSNPLRLRRDRRIVALVAKLKRQLKVHAA